MTTRWCDGGRLVCMCDDTPSRLSRSSRRTQEKATTVGDAADACGVAYHARQVTEVKIHLFDCSRSFTIGVPRTWDSLVRNAASRQAFVKPVSFYPLRVVARKGVAHLGRRLDQPTTSCGEESGTSADVDNRIVEWLNFHV